ncbi:MAG: hypothetical protein M1819_001510 [Sarea resinae]|nr:MAG: hypothetical protein M1819_001510 [Sarea resinae]
MATLSFDEIIQADRQRRKNEALANEIFGKNRRSSAPGGGALGGRKAVTGPPSLASRISSGKPANGGGIAKRSASLASPKPQAQKASIDDNKWSHDLHHVNNPRASRASRLNPKNASRLLPGSKLLKPLRQAQSTPAFNNTDRNLSRDDLFSTQATIHPASSIGIRIKGSAGPYIVIGSNFAPGTTADDIEAAFGPVGGAITRCRILASYPIVEAEIEFLEKSGAENVVATFDGRKADGRHLSLSLGPVSSAAPLTQAPAITTPPIIPTGPKASRPRPQSRFPPSQAQSQSQGRDRYQERTTSSRRGGPAARGPDEYIQDGRYGFTGDEDDVMGGVDDGRENARGGRGGRNGDADGSSSRGLYSDGLVGKQAKWGTPRRGR